MSGSVPTIEPDIYSFGLQEHSTTLLRTYSRDSIIEYTAKPDMRQCPAGFLSMNLISVLICGISVQLNLKI